MKFLSSPARRYRIWRASWPEQMHRRPVRLCAWLDLMFADQGLIRLFFNYPREVVPGVWRSAQPDPGRLKRLKRKGVTTVINLRGSSDTGRYVLEAYTCDRLGLDLVDIKMSSRRPPRVDQLRALHAAVSEARGGVLLHCKSGADRAGLASALCQIWSGIDLADAQLQLSLKYLHFKSAETGVLDHFLTVYARDGKPGLAGFMDWAETRYDRKEVTAGFKPSGWISVLVNRVLRRE